MSPPEGSRRRLSSAGDQALAWGHEFNALGPVSYGANDANSLAIIKDNTFGSFKMANVGAAFGTVDQDRLAGIRGDLTGTPTGADVTTIVRNLDNNQVRTGRTTIVDQNFLPGILFNAVIANADSTFDEIGDGTATSDWTISGKRDGDVPFSVRRRNLWASQDDVAADPAFEVAAAADALVNNEFENVTIDRVSYASKMATKFQQMHITRMEVKVGAGAYSSARSLTVAPGARLTVRISLRPYRSTTTSTRTLALTVPRNATGKTGALTAIGGVTLAELGSEIEEECLFEPALCTEEDGSLDTVIAGLTSAPLNASVTARLDLESETSEAIQTVSSTRLHPLTVTGERSIEIAVL